MNLRKNLENTLSSLLTHYGDSLTLFGEMVEVSHRQTPRKDCDAKAPRQYSTISGFRLSVALPSGSAAAAWSVAAASVYSIGEHRRGRRQKKRVTLVCPVCGKSRDLLSSQLKRRKSQFCIHCSRRAVGHLLASSQVSRINKHLTARARLDKALVGVRNRNELATALGVSRQRVHQLITAHGISLAGFCLEARVIWTCSNCGLLKITTRSGRPKGELCLACLREGSRVVIVCPTCGKARRIQKSQAALYKSERCRSCWRRENGRKLGLEVGRYNLAAFQAKRREEKERA